MSTWGMIELFFVCIIPLLLLAVGFLAGRFVEDRHLRSLAQREEETAYLSVTDLKRSHEAGDPQRGAILVTGEVVISSDYLKTFIAGWIQVFGGEVTPYKSLMNRARREAILRMKEQAIACGYDALGNVRLETIDLISSSPGNNPVVMVGVIASATAYKRVG